MKLLQTIKRWFREWFLRFLEDPEDLKKIELKTGETVTAQSVDGMLLICEGENSSRVVSCDCVKSKAQWIRVWKSLGGQHPKWPDGSDYLFYE